MRYAFKDLQIILKGDLLQNPFPNSIIEHLLIDSRQISFAHSSLFFAIKTKRRDGHDFIEHCYQKGVQNFIISENIDLKKYPNANFIFVKNTLHALQKLATFHRQQFPLKTIGITGSNGKTIIKEWLFQLLNPDFNIVRSPKSYNSQIGVPLSIWKIQDNHNLGIFEAGISEMEEMENLAPIINCEIGVFTNIGDAHQNGFPDLKTKLKEKLTLFQNTKTLIFCNDDDLVDETIQQEINSNETQFFTWSISGKKADLEIIKIEKETTHAQKMGTHFQAKFKDENLSFFVPSLLSTYTENILHCWATCLYLGLENKIIQKRILNLQPVKMRLEIKEGINNSLIINDSYNSDFTSLNIALNFLSQQNANQKKTLIISDILQREQNLDLFYNKVEQLIKEKGIQKIIGIGQEIQRISLNEYYENMQQFFQNFKTQNFRNETILLKGARSFEFEKIADRLSKKIHRTVLEVNLSALQHNLRVYSNLLQSGTKMMAMVKASAYGSGAIEVAKILEFSKVNYLAVAYADEGIELRKAGIQLPIMVLNPEKATFPSLLEFNLEPEVTNLIFFKELLSFLTTNEAFLIAKNQLKIHLKLDTGMHRLGFEEADLPDFFNLFSEESIYFHLFNKIKIQSILSHLAASETNLHDNFTQQQVQKYQQMVELITKKIGYQPLRHILNSGGIVRFPDFQFDMVRLGIGLYGIDSSREIQEDLQIVNSLKATISQIKIIQAGETVSYGRSGIAKKETRIATLSIGYADGLPRLAGNGNFNVLIHGKEAPIFGTICMDMCMVDISDIPEAKQGDEVEIFGKNLSVFELAKAAQTIPYEIFTNISERVKRVYFQE